VGIFDLGRENKLSYTASLALMWKAVLVSPQFLFMTPAGEVASDAKIVPLDDLSVGLASFLLAVVGAARRRTVGWQTMANCTSLRYCGRRWNVAEA
jgi:hypothetical protein